MTKQIDYIFPFVTMDDPNWQVEYKKYYPNGADEAMKGIIRFRDHGTLRYVFRSIEKYMPWINNVFIIVMSDSQVPAWINRETVKVVYHKDFIPEEYLPTFTSTSIEMFLHNIEGLSENFIYANDDMFIIDSFKPEDFFTNDKMLKCTRRRPKRYYWDYIRRNNYDLICGKDYDTGYVLTDQHGVTPYKKSLIKKCYEEHEAQILKSISKFRTKESYSRWLFDIYDYKNGYTISDRRYKVIKNDLSDERLFYKLKLNEYKVCCANDSNKVTIRHIQRFNKILSRRFSNKSKYEL